ncbi:MAG: hypothetical protein ACI9IP_003547 [Arcticibacterium sp.]
MGLSKEGLLGLYYWAETGGKIKATGFGRINFEPILVMREIYEINPKALLFETDLPSTRAPKLFSVKDIHLIKKNHIVRTGKHLLQ